MGSFLASNFGDQSSCRIEQTLGFLSSATYPRRVRRQRLRTVAGPAFGALAVAAAALGSGAQPLAPKAHAAPDPRVEYLYDVAVRRQYSFPNNDAVGYGYTICDKVSGGEGYPQLMGDVKRDVTPNDEFAANYLVSYAVNLLCPEQIWQLRNSATHYQPPAGS